jgi:hypothetical protein
LKLSNKPECCGDADSHKVISTTYVSEKNLITEWWVPAEDLEELNRNIVGKIEVIGEYQG